MKHFKQLVKELPAKKVVFTFGRFQPPTIGHGLLVAAVKHIAQKQNADHVIYASRSQDKKSNPLPVDRKVYYLKRMFPGANFLGANEHVRTFMEAAKELNKKYKNLIMVAGSDRVAEYQKLLNKYNGKDFHFDTIEVVSAGERDPDAEGASGMSGTKMREAAKKGDFDSFKKGLPQTLTTIDAKRLMNEIREGMGAEAIKEEVSFDTNELREAYHRGEIFNVGEMVKDDSGVYEIVDRGTNYLTVVNESGSMSKKWIHTVQSFKQVVEDIQPGPAPKEIKYKGYTTKNLHHSADATKAFQSTIDRMEKGLTAVNDPVALLNALKHTDEYMKLNDLHLEKGQPLDDKELASWKHSHAKAKEALERLGEFLHHLDYWHMHGHELEGLEAKYYPGTAGGEFADSYVPEGNLIEMKFAPTDKIKVARVIAGALGIEETDKSSNAEQLVNNGLRKVRSKPMRPEYIDVLNNMLQTAREAGIKFDEKLVPQKAKVEEGTKQPNGTDKVGDASPVLEVSQETLKSYIPKAMGSKSAADFTRGVKMAQGSGGEEELRKKSEKRSAGIHTAIKKLTKEELEEAAYWKNKAWQKKMADAAKKERQAREKKEAEQVKEGLDESRGQADKHWDEAEAHLAKAKKHKEGTEQYHGHMAAHFDSKSQYHSELGQYHAADRAGEKAEEHHEKMLKASGIHKEEVELEEGKMGELHDTISRHLDKHISDFKSGHTGMDQFGSKVLAAHKAVAKEHGLEHKHAVKHVNDYVDSKLNEERKLSEAVNVSHERYVRSHKKTAEGKGQWAFTNKRMGDVDYHKDNEFHKASGSFSDAKKSAKMWAQKHGHSTVYVMEEVDLTEGKDYSVTVTHYADGKHTKHEYTVKNANDYKHAKHIAMQKHGKKIGTLKQGEQYGASNMDVKELTKEEHEEINDLLEQIATAAMMGKSTLALKNKLASLRTDTKNNDSDVEATQQAKPTETKVGHSLVSPGDTDTTRKMKVRYQTEETELDEDQATAEYKVKTYYDNATGKTKTRKIRPHVVSFKNSKKNAEPEVDQPGENEVKEETEELLQTQFVEEKDDEVSEHDGVSSESDLEDMAAEIKDLDDIIDAYDDDELVIVDDETGEEIKEDVNEEALNEVLSRAERMRARIRFAKSKSKRERKMKIVLKSRSSAATINARSRRLAVKLMKQRIAKKPLSTLSVSEKERVEKMIQRRKAALNRLAMKLVPKIKKIEQSRLSHGKYTK